jgi:surface antigen
MRPRSSLWFLLLLAVCLFLPAGAPAQVNPLRGSGCRGLSPEDNQLLFDRIARLNAAEPSEVGRSEAWSNPQTKSFGNPTILRVFYPGGMTCHLVRHNVIVAGRQPGHNYRLTWCRAPRAGNGRSKADSDAAHGPSALWQGWAERAGGEGAVPRDIVP